MRRRPRPAPGPMPGLAIVGCPDQTHLTAQQDNGAALPGSFVHEELGPRAGWRQTRRKTQPPRAACVNMLETN